jgi:hypothetical protein
MPRKKRTPDDRVLAYAQALAAQRAAAIAVREAAKALTRDDIALLHVDDMAVTRPKERPSSELPPWEDASSAQVENSGEAGTSTDPGSVS